MEGGWKGLEGDGTALSMPFAAARGGRRGVGRGRNGARRPRPAATSTVPRAAPLRAAEARPGHGRAEVGTCGAGLVPRLGRR